MNQGTARLSPAPAGWPALVVVALLATTLVGIHLVVDPAAYDVSQLVRLLALMGLLAVAVPAVLLVPGIAGRLDGSVLREPIVLASAAYLMVSWGSLAAAANPSAGATDCFRTLGAFLVLGLTALLLPLDARWQRWLLEIAIGAALVTLVVGGWKTVPVLAEGLPSRRAMEEALLDGMMSNVNLFAAWLLLLVPWCLCGAAVLAGGWRGIAAVVAVAAIGLVVVVQSRAAWLGLTGAGVVAGLVLLWHPAALGATAGIRRAVAVVLAGGLAAAALVAAVALTDTPVGRAIQARVITRPHQAQGPSDGGRTLVWGIAARMAADHPLTGVGAGNFTIRMHEYFGPDKAAESPDFSRLSSDNWLQPHNDFLWVAAEKGLPGLVAFLAIFAAAGLAVRTVLRGPASVTDARLAVASLAAIVGHLIVSCLDFPLDRVSHQVVLAVHLGVLAVLAHLARGGGQARPLPGWLVVPPVVAALGLGLAYAAAALGQEREVMVARRAQHAGDWQAMRDAARRATTPWKTLDPLAVPVALLEGLAEMQLGDVPAATTCFERALAANPNRLAVLQNLGVAYAQAGRFDEAIAAFAIAANRYPDRLEVRHNLASALLDAGRFAEAIAVIEDIPAPLRSPPLAEALEYAAEQRAAEAAAK
jgi:O-antigen ligase